MSRDRVVSIALVLCTIVGARAAGPFDSTLILSSSKDERVAQDKRSDVADVNVKETVRGTTALMWAVQQRHPSAVKMLVELGADVGAKSAGAGLPRNYMAPRVDRAAVDAAAKRQQDAIAAGRTYNEQLEW